jgi:U3 small nucleolar RNA-associated protein 13
LKRTRQVVGYNDEVIDMAFIGPQQQHLAVVTNSDQIRIFSLDSCDSQIIYGHRDTILCMDRSSDGLLMATGSKDNTARLWAVDFTAAVGAATDEERVRCVGECVGHAESVSAVALSRRKQQAPLFMITGSQDCTVKRWDLSPLAQHNSEMVKLKSIYTHKAHEKDINSIAVAPNDRMFATGSQDKSVKLWNCEDGQLLGELKGHRRGVWCVRFSPVEQLIASASGDKTIKLWSTSDYSCLKVRVIIYRNLYVNIYRLLRAIQTLFYDWIS